MRRLAGLLYFVTGLAVLFVFIVLIGMALGLSHLMHSHMVLLVTPLAMTPPSMLILTGAAEIFPKGRRTGWWLLAGLLVIGALGVWTVPRIGWRLAARSIIGPEAAALVLAGLVLVAAKSGWLAAAIGSAVSAPFFLLGSGQAVYGHWASGDLLSSQSLWFFVPATLLILSFLVALRCKREFLVASRGSPP